MLEFLIGGLQQATNTAAPRRPDLSPQVFSVGLILKKSLIQSRSKNCVIREKVN